MKYNILFDQNSATIILICCLFKNKYLQKAPDPPETLFVVTFIPQYLYPAMVSMATNMTMFSHKVLSNWAISELYVGGPTMKLCQFYITTGEIHKYTEFPIVSQNCWLVLYSTKTVIFSIFLKERQFCIHVFKDKKNDVRLLNSPLLITLQAKIKFDAREKNYWPKSLGRVGSHLQLWCLWRVSCS